MKIQLSPVTISPSMYFPLLLPHIPTKTSMSMISGLLEAKRPPMLSIPAIPSPFSESVLSACSSISQIGQPSTFHHAYQLYSGLCLYRTIIVLQQVSGRIILLSEAFGLKLKHFEH